jgi:pyrimidine operon attenuation protein/uracil phosphoribosyltransferase
MTVESQRRVVMDAMAVQRALSRVAHEILEKNKGTEGLALVGVRSRGVHLAERIRHKIAQIEAVEIPCGIIDITLYRDDLDRREQRPAVMDTDIPFDVDGMHILLVDDVLFTGRTVRAAMDALVDFGRPQSIELVVLVDRGHRELPIRADYVGKNLPTNRRERVHVHLAESDGVDEVVIEG